MSDRDQQRSVLSVSRHRSLLGTILLAFAGAVVILVPELRATPLRFIFGSLLSLFLPGFALTQALFPGGVTGTFSGVDSNDEAMPPGIVTVSHFAYWIAGSLLLLGLTGFVLNFTPGGVQLVSVVSVLSGITIATAGLAILREQRTEPDTVSIRVQLRSMIVTPRTTTRAVHGLIIVSLVVSLSATGYVLYAPEYSEGPTELYLLGTEANGDITASGYPEQLRAADAQTVIVGLRNQGEQTRNYELVIKLQRLTVAGQEARVHSERILTRLYPTAQPNERWQTSYQPSTAVVGGLWFPEETAQPRAPSRERLVFLLYRDSAPPDPTRTNAFRETHLWVTTVPSPESNTTTRAQSRSNSHTV